ncbi:MAG: ABC transporter permease [Planctomycetota bacterium]
MKYSFRVAWREFAENATTKGFWIGILLFPVILLVSIEVQPLLEKAVPTRHYVLIDQSSQFESVIEAGFERIHQRDTFKAWGEYIGTWAKISETDRKKIDLEKVPAPDVEKLIEDFADANPEAVQAFASAGGLKVAREKAKSMGFLREDAPDFEEPKRRFQRAELPAEVAALLKPSGEGDGKTGPPSVDDLASALRPYLRGDKEIEVEGEKVSIFAAVLVPADIEQRIIRPSIIPKMPTSGREGIQYWSRNLADDKLKDEMKKAVNGEIRRREYKAKKVDTKVIEAIQRTRVPVASLNPKKEEGKEEVSTADVIRQWAPIAFVYLLWIGIFTISQMLLNNMIEEKSNRIVEVLLSSVTPRELMLGKLFGIAAVGLTMISVWILSLVTILALKAGPEAELATMMFEVLKTSGLLPAFVVYFILGYFMYSGIFLSIGSVCNTLKEAQNLMGPIMLVMVIPLFTMMFIPKDPNGVLATVLSWIPLYTPFVMMNRAAADPPLVDLIGTLILLLVTTLTVLWLTGKIFRTGILRTGQPPKLKELWRWVRGEA